MSIPQYKVIALKMGELYVDKSTLTHARDFGKMIWIPIWAAAIEGEGHRIVVDTGIHDQKWVNDNVDPCRRAEDETITKALEVSVGWSPNEVDIVINTHLHYDHCGGNALFNNARFYLQAAEWEHAFKPIDSQKWVYEDTRFLYDSSSVNFFQWHFLKGDSEILPGLKVLHTPGHTPGQQTILVNTEDGILAMISDVANLLENVNENVPPGIISDTQQCYNSYAKVRAIADRVFPGHEPSIKKFQDSGFPLIKK